MPLTTEPTPDFQGIVHVGSGFVTGDEFVKASHDALLLVQNTQNFHYEFPDLSAATGLKITEAQLDKITSQDRLAATYRPDAVIVIVASLDELFELGQLWEERVRHLGWRTHDRAAGIDWLHNNFPPPPREELEARIASASSVDE